MQMLLLITTIGTRMNKEASLGLRLILDGMNRSQMPMKTQKQQREQWTLSLDGSIKLAAHSSMGYVQADETCERKVWKPARSHY
uniref:Uncharacterized protein n=1 Tax=Oryza meridionalis TaxID=40149 RepID=A0A0E0E5F8_9ORYZ